MERGDGDFGASVSGVPAGEVHLVAAEVNVVVGEDGGHLPEEAAHEVVRAVENGVDWAPGPRGPGTGEARRQKTRLSWGGNPESRAPALGLFFLFPHPH